MGVRRVGVDASWLRHHCRMSNREANALIHRGRFLDKFEAIGDAASAGVLSAGQVGALQASCPSPVEPVMDAQQAELVAIVLRFRSETPNALLRCGANAPKHSSICPNRSNRTGSCASPTAPTGSSVRSCSTQPEQHN